MAIACSSFATTLMKGKSLDEIHKLTINDLIQLTGNLPESKMYVAYAVVNAMHGAVESYYNKQG